MVLYLKQKSPSGFMLKGFNDKVTTVLHFDLLFLSFSFSFDCLIRLFPHMTQHNSPELM